MKKKRKKVSNFIKFRIEIVLILVFSVVMLSPVLDYISPFAVELRLCGIIKNNDENKIIKIGYV